MLSVKTKIRIYFPFIVDLKLFVDDLIQKYNLKNHLFGTIHNNSSINEGNYYSLIKIENERLEFNDSFFI